MNPIKRVLVALDLSEIDESVISYTSFLDGIFGFNKIYFFHVARNLELPKRLTDKYPDLLAPPDETIKGLIKDNVENFFNGKAEVSIEVHEGNAEDKILRWSKIKEVDLMIVGRKNHLNGSGQLPNSLAKHGPCSMLAVPEKVKSKMEKLMVAMDFSRSSKIALDGAVEISKNTGAKIVIQHTYVVPTGYHTSGKSYEEFSEIIKGHSQDEAEQVMKEKNLSVKVCDIALSLDDNTEPSDRIYEDAVNHNVNLLIIASKGRTGLANVLLGSVADKLLQYKGDIPVMVVKNRKENLGFIDALLRL